MRFENRAASASCALHHRTSGLPHAETMTLRLAYTYVIAANVRLLQLKIARAATAVHTKRDARR